MKVFISWSGNKSHEVGKVLKWWLPMVIQATKPFLSSEDIEKGTRWSKDIAEALNTSRFGIICVTKENQNAPWLLFEAGAISKAIEESYVCPFLFDIERSDLKGPLTQFQYTVFQKEDIKKLVNTINKASDNIVSESSLEAIFEVMYPKLEEALNKLKSDYQETEAKAGKGEEEVHQQWKSDKEDYKSAQQNMEEDQLADLNKLCITINGTKIEADSVKPFYTKVFDYLKENQIGFDHLVPYKTGNKRYLINKNGVHINGNAFFSPMTYNGYYIETHKSKSSAKMDIVKFLKELNLNVTCG